MGYRIASEETFRPYNAKLPQYDQGGANRVTDQLRYMSEEQARARREAADMTAQNLTDIIDKPLAAYRTQADRNRKAAESDREMLLNEKRLGLTEEQLLGAKQTREQEAQYGGRERESRIGQNEAARALAQQQVEEGKATQDFLNATSTAPGALANETNRQRQLRTGIEQGQGALDVQKSQIKVAEAQVQAQKELAGLNKANLQVEIETRRQGLDEAQRVTRVRDLVGRLAAAGDDPVATQAIAAELAKTAKPAEIGEALSTVRGNQMTKNVMMAELARRDENRPFLVSRMQDASDKAQQIAIINANLEDALKRYTDAKTPWSDSARDAIRNIQSQLRAAEYTSQAADLDSIVSPMGAFEGELSRKNRAAEAIRRLQTSLGSEYSMGYGHLGPQFKKFGQQIEARAFSGASASAGGNIWMNQGQPQNQAIDLPLPSQLGPNFMQQFQGAPQQAAPQNVPQQNIPPQSQPNMQPIRDALPSPNNNMPWMGIQGGGQQGAPQQGGVQPLNLPPSAKLKQRVVGQ